MHTQTTAVLSKANNVWLSMGIMHTQHKETRPGHVIKLDSLFLKLFCMSMVLSTSILY